MKKFTKSLMTLALLGVAGVVNAQSWTEISPLSFSVNEFLDGTTQTHDVHTDGDAMKVHVRSAVDAGKADDQWLDGWDSQFFITFGEDNAVVEGDKIKISFDVKADHAQNIPTQSHKAPGGYIHWYGIGDVAATDSWAEFSKEVEVASDESWGHMQQGCYTIAFNLTPEPERENGALKNPDDKSSEIQVQNNFYFKNVKIEIQKAAPAAPITWATIVDGDESCYYKKENRGEPGPAEVVNGVVTVTCPALVDNPWDSQFWIRLPQAVESGTKCHVTFKYKASAAVNPGAPQIHNEPSEYCGNTSLPALDCSNASDWTDYEGTFTVSSNNGSFQSLAFNLSVENVDVIYYFKDAKVEIPQEAVVTGISEISVEKASEGIFDLSGRRVKTFNKGIYVVDGKKVVK